MRALAVAQQGQRGLDAIRRPDEIGRDNAPHQGGVEEPRLQVFAGSGIEDDTIQTAPRLPNGAGSHGDLVRVRDIRGNYQHLPRIALRQGLERFRPARRQRQVVTVRGDRSAMAAPMPLLAPVSQTRVMPASA